MNGEFAEIIPEDWASGKESHSSSKTLQKEEPIFFRDGKKRVVNCSENVLIAVRWLFQNQMRFNAWTGRRETNVSGKWQQLSDYDYMLIRSAIEKKFAYDATRKVTLSSIVEAVHQYCFENKYNPVVDYFTNLYHEWDKIPRLDTWLCHAYGVPDNPYYRSIGSNWIKGMVKRALQPGVKFDYVLALEGAQGIGKSTSLAVLGGDWHTEITFSPDNKDFFMALQGHLIVEFSEGETLSRSEVKQLKSVISATKDTFRPPYGREMVDVPRRCVFAMTTNQSEYLKDETGNRRWLPVECVKIDIEWLKENRDQLFAEAMERLEDKEETAHEFPLDEVLEMQASRLIADPDMEKVVDWYFLKLSESEREAGVATEQAFEGIQPQLGYMKLAKMSRAEQMRIGTIFTNTLKLEKRRIMRDAIRLFRYYPSEATKALAPKDIPADIKEFMEF